MIIQKNDVRKFLKRKNYSDSTKKSYKSVLYNFVEKSGELNEDDVLVYLDKQYEHDKSWNTALQIIRSFARELEVRVPPSDPESEYKKHDLNLVKNIGLKKTREVLKKKEFSDEELRKILDIVDPYYYDGVWCLSWYGCRPGELFSLTSDLINRTPDQYLPPSLLQDLSQEDYCVKFLTEKTKVERACFMDEYTRDRLVNFLEKGYKYGALYKYIKRAGKELDLNISPKWFRSTFQTKMQRRLLEVGVSTVNPSMLVKVMSGHTVTRDITSVYTDFGPDILSAMTEHHFMKDLENGD